MPLPVLKGKKENDKFLRAYDLPSGGLLGDKPPVLISVFMQKLLANIVNKV